MRPGTRGTTLVCCAVAAALFAAGTAFGASQTIVGADNTFSLATYTMDQGEKPPFQNIGPFNPHNATAAANGPDGKVLFKSPTIGPGSTTLDGTQYLTAGSYAFICTIHPTTMIATLAVSGNGTPVARPDIELKVVSRKIEKVASKGRLQIQVQAVTKSDDAEVTAKLGKTTLGTLTDLDLAAGAIQNATLSLNKATRNKLSRKAKATVSLEGTVPFGSPATAKGKLK